MRVIREVSGHDADVERAMQVPRTIVEQRTPFNVQVEFPDGEIVGTGWIPPMPDMRDYTPQTEPVRAASQTLNVPSPENPAGPISATVPPSVDLRQWCSPIENQLGLGSCTANAAAGIVEYFERRAFDNYIDASRLFIYKTTRDLLGWVGDTGAYIRTAMGALAMFGTPPEKYWPYTDAHQPGLDGARTFDDEPSAFVYEVAEHWEAMNYFSLDPLGLNVPPATVLSNLKAYIAAGIPAMFGFYGFPSFSKTTVKGGIPYPCEGEEAQWGHAIVAVGYDDAKTVDNAVCQTSTTGALLIRNSWGPAWGDGGYGWMPYEYVLNRLASDFWHLTSMRWLDTGRFGL
ncbi:hypothetical protein OU415_07560 [Saccharopolyspora sp. WRP15-2]|uniref:Peptidase C1A papain C-terminal domain-containing protein n=1 Tax=Saccharopolyspora oryzae TaxID=2997343 RepID=A0ABT4UU82_9PSEU|nr:C1 family peptidase [Saccharopolyspora oryzae]MDA3625287.1 hypothetical protein [Saccharopolyspora oryzae]